MINVAQVILSQIEKAPQQSVAYVDSRGQQWTYGQIHRAINNYRHALGLTLDQNTSQVICVANPGIKLISLLVACFAEGKTVIFIDPKLGLKTFFNLLKEFKKAQLILDLPWFVRFIVRILFFQFNIKNVQLDLVTINQIKTCSTLNTWLMDGFTSGTTGQMKQIKREHSHLIASSEVLNRFFIQLKPDVHLVGYTLSVIRNLIDQGTAIDRPRELSLKFLNDLNIQRISGPPSLLYEIICLYENSKSTNEQVKNIIIGGAPVQRWLVEKTKNIFPKAQLQIIYGCTECEPISVTNGDEILKKSVNGYFVGKPVQELEVHYEEVGENLFELFIKGPQVTKSEGHWTGDLVRKDSEQNIFLVGRKKYLLLNTVGSFFGQFEIEVAIENEFIGIKKAAVISKNDRLVVFIEFFKEISIDETLLTQKIKMFVQKFKFSDTEVQILSKLPYDNRHRWKVQYEKLSKLV